MYLWNKVTAERLEELKAEKIGKDGMEILEDRVIDNIRKIIWYV